MIDSLAKKRVAALTPAEMDTVAHKIGECWLAPVNGTALHAPEFRLDMNPDGTVRAATLLNGQYAEEPQFGALADSARRALANPNCQLLPFPPGKYEAWKTFTITFAPQHL